MAKKLPPAPHAGASAKSSTEHMQRRRDSGLSIRGVAKEFGLPKSTVHRTLTQGFTPLGAAGQPRLPNPTPKKGK